MRNFRISRLLPALFVLMVVLGALQGAVAFRSLSALTGHIERIGTERMPQMNGILQLSHAFAELNATYSEHLLSMDPDEIGRIEGRIKERTEAFAGMVERYGAANRGDAATVAEIDGIKATLKTYLEESQSSSSSPPSPPRGRRWRFTRGRCRRAPTRSAPR